MKNQIAFFNLVSRPLLGQLRDADLCLAAEVTSCMVDVNAKRSFALRRVPKQVLGNQGKPESPL